MGHFSLEINQQQLSDVATLLSDIKNGAGKAVSRAVNKTLVGVRTDSAREIAKELNVAQKEIKKDFSIKKTQAAELNGHFRSMGKPLPLIAFSARQTKTGVSVLIKKSKGRKDIPGAFIAEMKSGHQGVFSRKKERIGTGTPLGTPKAGYLWGNPVFWDRKYRLPVHELHGPRVEDILENEDTMGLVMLQADQRLQKNLDHEAHYLVLQKLEAGDGTEGIVE